MKRPLVYVVIAILLAVSAGWNLPCQGEVNLNSTLDSHDPRQEEQGSKTGSVAENPDPTTQPKTGKVSAKSFLNVRAGPWGKILGKLEPGAAVKILETRGDWYKIEWQGKTAFVHSHYVALDEPTGTPTGNSVGSSTDVVQNGPSTSPDNGKPEPASPSPQGSQPSGQEGGTRLAVPYYNQRNPANGPLRDVACGPTCLAMVLGFYGINVPITSLIKACQVSEPTGCYTTDIEQAAKQYRPSAQAFSGMSIDWVKQQILAGKPVICNIPGHFTVCVGIDQEGNFLFNDPWDRNEPWRQRMSPEEFQNQFQGYAVTM